MAIDLFSGAGGLSLGLQNAGFNVALAVDIDDWALETHAHHFEGLALNLDLGDPTDRKGLIQFLGGIDISLVAGGPPCQPFSRAGRSKLRNLVATGKRDPLDMRKELWRAFLDVVEHVEPTAVLMENVPDMALGDDMEAIRELVGRLEGLGYQVDARIVDTWLHGVPQHRQRLIVAGTPIESAFSWPEPDDPVDLWAAIGDLPLLSVSADAPVGGEVLPYAGSHSDFTRRARKECLGDESSVVFDHLTRSVRADDLEAFRLMKPGTLYSELPEELKRYRSDIFDDKYNRLDWGDLSRSITAHIAKDGYWYIHPSQDRTLTVREAARIQTFPDHFRFAGSRSHQFAQIGNAVPPALGEAIGAALLESRDYSANGREKVDLRKWRASIRTTLSELADKDGKAAPWVYPSDPWTALVGQIVGPTSSGWPEPADVLSWIPTLSQATLPAMEVLCVMADDGPRARAVERLSRLADALRGVDIQDGDAVRSAVAIELKPAEQAWFETLGLGNSALVTSTAVLRVVARLTGTTVDVTNRLSAGRLELAKLVGFGSDAVIVNAAMHRLGTDTCTAQDPDCRSCPLSSHCPSTAA